MQYVPRSAIIARLGIIGDGMCEKIEVLGLQLDGFTAKEAMQEAIRYMETEPISTIEILAGTSVVELTETGDLRDKLPRWSFSLWATGRFWSFPGLRTGPF